MTGSSRAAYGVGVYDDNIFGAKASVSALSGRRAAKLPLAAGEQPRVICCHPAKLRRWMATSVQKPCRQKFGIALGAGGGD